VKAGEADPLGRLADVLTAGGAGALFRDKELLQALARVAADDPATYAGIKADIRGQVSPKELDKALKPLLSEQSRSRPPTIQNAGDYRVVAGCIVREFLTSTGPAQALLANFQARIVEQITYDDGAEKSILLALEGELPSGTRLSRAEVAADEFTRMDWVLPAWGNRPVVCAGMGTKDHLRAAIQLLSGDVPPQTTYTHLGWRRIGDRWHYLHAGGAIGPDGPACNVAVSPPTALSRFELPAPPTGHELAEAIRASLRLLDLAPERITFPLMAGVYRAVLGDCDFSLHLAGPTGNYKSELAALCQQHFGAAMVRKELPGNWSSTGNSLEGIAFAAKDTLLVVDDFAPSGSSNDVARYHREAERLFRAQGNHAGRQRMRADGAIRPEKPPRGLVLSTGEDVPRGQSVRARLFVLEVGPGNVNLQNLTACQRDAASGKYTHALAGFIQWLARPYESLKAGLCDEVAKLRSQALARHHARTPEIVANLAVGWRYFLAFAREAGALSKEEAEQLWKRGWEAFGEAAQSQAGHQADAEPSGKFLRLLSAALASGRAHVAGNDGNAPEDRPEAWGWRRGNTGQLESQGRRIGWIKDGDLYLEPEAAFAEAQELAGKQGDALPVNPRTLWRRMKEKGLLAVSDEARERLKVRRVLEGTQREVIAIAKDGLSPSPTVQSVHFGQEVPETPEEMDGFNGQSDGRLDGSPAQPSSQTVQKNGHISGNGQFGRSDSGREKTQDGKSYSDSPGPYEEGF
jgi:hypothetical protein